MSPSSIRRTYTAMLAALAFVAASVGFAAQAASLSAQQSAAVQKISAYFNSIKTLQGEFTQISPKGNVSSGIFHILKPGKLRFEYSPPNPFLIVSDGTWLVVQNRKKNRSDEYPLSKTPLRLMLSKHVDLLKQADIKKVETQDGLTTVTLEDRDQLVPGHLILVFDDGKNALQQWSVIDGKGRRTTVALNKIVSGKAVDKKLFRVKRKDRTKSKTDR